MDAWKETVWNQFGAALDMLENTIPACPDDLWDDRTLPPPYWHIVYHTLFYTDLYLSESEDAFTPAPFHTPNAQFLGEMPFPPHKAETPAWTPSKPDLVAYSEHCRNKLRMVILSITEEKLVQKTAFYWLPFPTGTSFSTTCGMCSIIPPSLPCCSARLDRPRRGGSASPNGR